MAVPDMQLLKGREVASLLNVDRTTLWRWYTQGAFPKPIKIGGASRFKRADVLAWIESRPTSDPAA